MKVSIRDPHILRSVGPIELAAYLRAHGWRETDRREGRYSLWLLDGGGAEIEVLLPLEPAFRDYPARIADALRTLEVAEQRSQLEILADMTSESADVVRVRPETEGIYDGTLPIERGVALADA